MAEEAFALSPISARAAQPSEEDYEAIREAFMETSRGRWFLGEYAKRNRNADTRLVLDAVQRIEHGLAAQKQSAAEDRLAEALDAITSAVDQAKAAATEALKDTNLQDALAPVGKGARIIREISWRWREIGADGRICDLIDSQIAAIEDACSQIASTDRQAGLMAAFALIEQRIAALGSPDRPAAAAAAASASSPSPSSQPNDAASVEAKGTSSAIKPVNASAAAQASTTPHVEEMAREERADRTADASDDSHQPEMTVEAAQAHDEAVLDLVAFEMAAEADDEFIDPDASEVSVASPPPAREVVAKQPEPAAPPAAANGTVRPSLRPSAERSLGSTLIETGMVRKSSVSPSDPLAPIRRMSQAERIALFS